MNSRFAYLLLSFLILINVAYAAAPTIGIMSLESPVNLVTGSTRSINCNSTYTDTDGWSNVSVTNATFWHSSSSENAADDLNYHYTNSSCLVGTNTSLDSAPVICKFDLQYYSNSGNWTCKIRAWDNLNEGTNETNSTINTLASINVPTDINLGAFSLGAISSNSSENVTAVENAGNILLDVDLSGTLMSCLSGTIPIANLKYSSVDDTAYPSMTALTGTSSTLDLNIAQRTDSASTKDVFWKIQIPSMGVGGICTNTVTFTAIAS